MYRKLRQSHQDIAVISVAPEQSSGASEQPRNKALSAFFHFFGVIVFALLVIFFLIAFGFFMNGQASGDEADCCAPSICCDFDFNLGTLRE